MLQKTGTKLYFCYEHSLLTNLAPSIESCNTVQLVYKTSSTIVTKYKISS